MGGDSPHNPLDSILAGSRSSQEMKRIASRRLFREMVKGETENGPLSFLRRRALVRFASRLSIGPDEARLIIRGVEFECGLIAGATARELLEADQEASRRRIANLDAVLRIGLIALVAVLFTLVFRWVSRSSW